jgi:hypothetical protein
MGSADPCSCRASGAGVASTTAQLAAAGAESGSCCAWWQAAGWCSHVMLHGRHAIHVWEVAPCPLPHPPLLLVRPSGRLMSCTATSLTLGSFAQAGGLLRSKRQPNLSAASHGVAPSLPLVEASLGPARAAGRRAVPVQGRLQALGHAAGVRRAWASAMGLARRWLMRKLRLAAAGEVTRCQVDWCNQSQGRRH